MAKKARKRLNLIPAHDKKALISLQMKRKDDDGIWKETRKP